MAKRKNRYTTLIMKTLWLIFFCVVFVLSVLTVWKYKKHIRRFYRKYVSHQPRTPLRPTEFPIDYTINGLDISHYQDEVDWDNLYSVTDDYDTIRHQFVLIKATEGILLSDEDFDDNWKDAGSNRFIRGAYHYFKPNRSGTMQAKNFIRHVKLKKGDLPPILDIEELGNQSPDELIASLKVMLFELEKHYGVKPIIYSNVAFIETYLEDDLSDYKFWIAHYYVSSPAVNEKIRWLFWQHTDRASVKGVDGPVDGNVFNGSERDLKRILIK